MNRIEKLLAEMTLAEKLGQLTMTACGYAVTGPVIAGDSTDSIRNGTIGNLLNLVGAGPVREMQRLAVEQSRLRHSAADRPGHHPRAPHAVSDSAGRDGTVRSANLGAYGTRGGRSKRRRRLSLTFAPMIDVSRDPRWGRTAEGPGEDPWVGARLAAAKVRGFQGTRSGRVPSRWPPAPSTSAPTVR